jgi:hypothetical protein
MSYASSPRMITSVDRMIATIAELSAMPLR